MKAGEQQSRRMMMGDWRPEPQVGDVVTLADGTRGILMGAIDETGRAPVMRLPRG